MIMMGEEIYSRIDTMVEPYREYYELDPKDHLYTLEFFTDHYDIDFLNNAYRTIFSRLPDDAGLTLYLPLLRSAKRSKIEILVDLRYSNEGIENGISISGLEQRKFFAKVSKIPYVGSMIRWFHSLWTYPHSIEQSALLETKLYQAKKETHQSYNYPLNHLLYERYIYRIADFTTVSKKDKSSVHQLIYRYRAQDPITIEAEMIRDRLVSAGFDSEIFVQFMDEDSQASCMLFDPALLQSEAGIIYHYTIGCEMVNRLSSHQGKKVLIYHGTTPKDFFELYDRGYAKLLELSRSQLKSLAGQFDYLYANSNFTARELNYLGYEDISILYPPILYENSMTTGMNTIAVDRSKIVLFKGDISPQNGVTDLIEVFYWLKQIKSSVELIVIGEEDISPIYTREVYALIERYGLSEDIIITGKIQRDKISDYYRRANIYLSFNRYEGFGSHLMEAIYSNTPILALRATSAPETLGDNAFLFRETQDLLSVAGAACLLLSDEVVKDRILSQQEVVKEKYSLKSLDTNYQYLIKRFSHD